MSNKFVPLETVIEADWLNQVDDHLNMPHNGGTGGTTDHSVLTNRSAADSHPIAAITGLQAALATEGSGNLIAVPTLADLVTFNKPSVLSVWLQGRDTPGDQGCGLFTRCTGDYSMLIGQDPLQGIYVSAGTNQCWVRQYPKGEIRPEWFGNTYTHVELQAAANLLKDGETLIIAPGTIWSIGVTVTISASRARITSIGGFSEGMPMLRATVPGIVLVKMAKWGCLVENIGFVGTDADQQNTTTQYPTTQGVAFDQRTVDPNTGANIDGKVFRCGFAYLKQGMQFYGRNIEIYNCLFTECFEPIVGNVFVDSQGIKLSFRGVEIKNNRFHMCGTPWNNLTLNTPEPVCIRMPIDSNPAVGGGIIAGQVIVDGNYADECGHFYRGTLENSKITNNILIMAHGRFIDCDSEPTATYCNMNGSTIIANNVWTGRASTEFPTTQRETDYGIITNAVANLLITGNALQNSTKALIRLSNGVECTIQNNWLKNANIAHARPDVGDHGAIEVSVNDNVGVRFMFINNNIVLGIVEATDKVPHYYGIKIMTGTKLIIIGMNMIMNSRSGILVYSAEVDTIPIQCMPDLAFNNLGTYGNWVYAGSQWPGKSGALRIVGDLEVSGSIEYAGTITDTVP